MWLDYSEYYSVSQKILS